MSTVRSAVTVGRRAELALLRHLVAAVPAGRGQAVCLLGDAGFGKTRVVEEATLEGSAVGITVMAGHCVPGAAGTPYRPLARAVATVLRDPNRQRDRQLAALRPVLATLDAPPVAGRPSVGVVGIAETMLRLLEVVGRCILVVEDIHWADEDTLAVLEYLAGAAATHGALLVLTARPLPPTPGSVVLERLADRRVLSVVELAPLNDDEVGAMVAACLGQEAADADLVGFVRRRAGGNPFNVEELLAGLERSGAMVKGHNDWRLVGRRVLTVAPTSVAASFALRVQSLAPASREVLAAAAVLGHSFDWRLLADIVGGAESTVLASLREASYTGLLAVDGDEMRFRHALTRDEVVALLVPPDRVRLARRALEVLRRSSPGLPGEDCETAAELAELAGDNGAAGELLVESGARARRRGALSSAAGRLERARQVAPDRDDVQWVATRYLAEVRALQGDLDAATRLAVSAGQPPAGTRAGAWDIELELLIARAASAAGEHEQAELHVARARHQPAPNALVTCAITTAQAQIAVNAGRMPQAEVFAAEVLADAAAAVEMRCEAYEVLGRCARLHDLAAAEGAFTDSLKLADTHGLAVWRARALHELGTVDLLDTMRLDRLQAARRSAVETGAVGTLAAVDFHLAEALVTRGQPEPARQAARAAAALAERIGSAILPVALITVAQSYAHELRQTDMDEAIADARRAAPADPAIEAGIWGRARVMLALHQADAAAGLRAMDQAVEQLRLRPAHHFPHWGLWALLRSAADQDSAAACDEASRAAGSDTRLNRALLAAAQAIQEGRSAQHETAEPRLAQAVDTLRGYEHVDWLIHLTHWLVAPAASRDGWGQPIHWLQSAVRYFSEHEYYGALATSSRVMLRDLGGSVPRHGRGTTVVPEALAGTAVTSREADVLALLQRGLTNQQIAAVLVVSPRTVEKHIGNLLQKTGQPDRVALGALAEQLGMTPPDP